MRIRDGRSVLRVVQAAMGLAGELDYPEVARLAGLDARTVRRADEKTTVGTLWKIADGLDLELEISIRAKGRSTP